MKTIIDKAGLTSDTLTDDVQTAFTTYKALDRLRALAEAATSKTASAAQRAALEKTFAKGLADLQAYLPSRAVGHARPGLRAAQHHRQERGGAPGNFYEVQGKGLVKNRSDALPGLTGQEKFSVTLGRPGVSENVTVDLSQGPQPPTIDSVAEALNTAIATTPALNADGTPRLDKDGNVVSKWSVRFVPEKGEDNQWALKLDSPSGMEADHARPDRREGRAGGRHRPDPARRADFDPGLPFRRSRRCLDAHGDGHHRRARSRCDGARRFWPARPRRRPA
jgi:hypothetical protein